MNKFYYDDQIDCENCGANDYSLSILINVPAYICNDGEVIKYKGATERTVRVECQQCGLPTKKSKLREVEIRT